MNKIQLKPESSQEKQKERTSLPKPSSSIAPLTKPFILSIAFMLSATKCFCELGLGLKISFDGYRSRQRRKGLLGKPGQRL